MTSAEIYESLQNEFCPPLDGSLLTALLNDVFYNADGSARSPTKKEIKKLRSTLRELVISAEEEQTSEDFSDLNYSTSPTDDSCTTPELLTSDWTSTSSEFSSDYGSPLQFLRAALPDIPITTLRNALLAQDDVDIEQIVDNVLSRQFMCELEERGLQTSLTGGAQDRSKTVQKKKQQKAKQVITFGDVRQRGPTRPSRNPVQASPDPWTSISSISAQLATLIPSKTPSFFQPYFHSPKYPTPYDAVYAALASLGVSDDDHDDVLFSLLDILLPSYPNCSLSVLVSDVEVAITAANGDADAAIDVVHLLRSLDNGSLGSPHHISPPSLSPLTPVSPSASPVLPSKYSGSSSTQTNYDGPKQAQQDKYSPHQWQTVPSRKPPNKMYEHAEYIPAYSYSAGKHKSPGNAAGKGGKGDVGELMYRSRMEENLRKRREMVQEASRMWNRGTKKNRGGEIAFYFAERARQFQEQAQKEALNAARAMVHSKMRTSGEKNTVDLHGLTSAEAITIVKEIIADKPPTAAMPLNIITGRGTHSANNVAVLKPAIQNALVKEGWRVTVRDASLLVSGR